MNPGALFSKTSDGCAFYLGKGALCNTCQHQLVVTGLHVSAAFRVSRQTNGNLLISILLAAGRSIRYHNKPFTPQPLTTSRLRRSVKKTVVQRKKSCRANLSLFAAFSLRLPVSHKAPSITPSGFKNRQMHCLKL